MMKKISKRYNTISSEELFLIMEKVIENILKIMHQKGVSQEVLADKIHVTQGGLNQTLNQKRGLSLKKLLQIADALGVDITYLFTYPNDLKNTKESNLLNEPKAFYNVKKKIDNLIDALDEIDNLKIQLEYSKKIIEEKERTINILQNQLK